MYEGIDIQRFVNVKICLNLIKDTDDFQDPYASLNPRLKVMDIVAEGIDIHHLASDKRDRKSVFMIYLKLLG